MKTRIALAFSLAPSLFASSAFADEISATAKPAARSSIGAQVDYLPSGEVDTEGKGFDLEPAFAIGGFVDFAVGPNLTIGGAPRLILGVQGEDERESHTALDLRVRLKGTLPVAPRLAAFGYLAPGYSIIFLETNSANGVTISDPSGIVFAVGAGLTYDVSDRIFFSGELAYQAGFHTMKATDGVESAEGDAGTSYFGFGFGIGNRF